MLGFNALKRVDAFSPLARIDFICSLHNAEQLGALLSQVAGERPIVKKLVEDSALEPKQHAQVTRVLEISEQFQHGA